MRYGDDPQAAGPIAMLRRQSDHLARLLDDLLDVTRIAQGRVTLKHEPLEIGAVVDQAVETVTPLAKAKSQLLRVERDAAPLYVSGDRARLVQTRDQRAAKRRQVHPRAWRDRRRRARRRTRPRDCRAATTASASRPSSCRACSSCSCRASGRSIARKGASASGCRSSNGSSRCTAVPSRVASEGHGRGTTVTIRLPRIEAPAQCNPFAGGPRAPARRVLVVDDSADAADSLALLLELEGHEVATAYSASAALEAAERLQPDVAFIDIGLPQMDGYEVARRLRASDCCRGTRLVALTGYGQPDDRDEARRAGFDHHLVKPADWRSIGAISERPGLSSLRARAAARRPATCSGFRRQCATPRAHRRATGNRRARRQPLPPRAQGP